jgi:hypothetical protein
MGRLRGGFDSFLRVAKGHRKPKSTLLAAYTRFLVVLVMLFVWRV